MNDRYIEKKFIYLLFLSLILHIGAFAALYYFSASPPERPKEPVFMDLQQMQEPKPSVAQHQQETKRRSEQRVRVPRESAPRGDAAQDLQALKKRTATSTERQPSPAPRTVPSTSPVSPGSSAASLLRPKPPATQKQSTAPQLFPGARSMAGLENSYRRKFENDIAEGDTRFLNSDDIVFGSFLRRFEGAVYGVWRYPQEAAMNGIEGITPVRITFNRRGEITKIQQLESSGARILDEEVLRTLRAIGPVGGFPKGYNKEEFHLIAFFQYGGARRSLR
ncbi:MAG: TonB family protein [Desulfuromonadaceae bacterium]|nr:TonB family protein [Desulfuromonadaceae bacterium]